MPIYEFYSPNTRKIYSFYSRTLQNSYGIPLCPDGKEYEMKKLFSGFSITSGQSASSIQQTDSMNHEDSDPFSKLTQSQTTQVMQEMEKAMGGIDDENPDPRQMGALMRRMCEMTGEKMDGVMEEVVRKLEEGENPEDLESKMEGIIDEEKTDEEGHGDEVANISLRKSKKLVLSRDPELYEMSDYLI